MLRVRDKVVAYKMIHYPAFDNSFKNLAYNAGEADWSVAVRIVPATSLEDRCNGGSLPRQGYFTKIQRLLKEIK